MKAISLRLNDIERGRYLVAWLSHVAGATEEKGDKQVAKYAHFDDFYDYYSKERAILGKDEELAIESKVEHLMKRINRG